MENLVFSLDATLPVFLLMVAGGVLGRLGFLPAAFCKAADRLTFTVTLPVMLFLDMAGLNIRRDFEPKFVLFCAGATLAGILATWVLARALMRDKAVVGEFVQAAYRSSAAILGVAFIQNIYGSSGMAPLMILGSVPLFNIFAVLILMIESPQHQAPRPARVLRGVLTNPILLGIVAGTVFSLLPVQMPAIAEKTLTSLSSLTTPLALLSIGASFKGASAIRRAGPTLAAALYQDGGGFRWCSSPARWLWGSASRNWWRCSSCWAAPRRPAPMSWPGTWGTKGCSRPARWPLTTLLSALTLTGWIFVLRSGGWL